MFFNVKNCRNFKFLIKKLQIFYLNAMQKRASRGPSRGSCRKQKNYFISFCLDVQEKFSAHSVFPTLRSLGSKSRTDRQSYKILAA
jgi:hypothetical protein